ncbi:MAG TPA: hypothetical protein VIS57_04680 [Xanthomonadales bacterium]
MNKYILYAFIMVVSLFAVSANAAPMAYSVNSDGINDDNLYLIDLATGVDQYRGKLFTGIENEYRTDTEGLAFSPGPNSRLWGIDDASGTLFPINPNTGSVNYNEEIQLPLDFQSGGGNDFGMTFACDNSLFFTSVRTQSLYRREPTTGSITNVGSLGVNISAIAAFGNPTLLYGLGNSQFLNGDTDSPNLYSIDTTTGHASLIGPLGSPGEFEYNQAGMSFDSAGGLWAITDRSQIGNQKSQILSINVETGDATLIATTLNEVGYESLAISPPVNCIAAPVDGADDLPAIPSLSLPGKLSAILVLMLAGMLILRRRYS